MPIILSCGRPLHNRRRGQGLPSPGEPCETLSSSRKTVGTEMTWIDIMQYLGADASLNSDPVSWYGAGFSPERQSFARVSSPGRGNLLAAARVMRRSPDEKGGGLRVRLVARNGHLGGTEPCGVIGPRLHSIVKQR